MNIKPAEEEHNHDSSYVHEHDSSHEHVHEHDDYVEQSGHAGHEHLEGGGFWSEYISLLTSPSHIAFEITISLLFDFLVGYLIIKQLIIPRLTKKIHKEIDEEHSAEGCDIHDCHCQHPTHEESIMTESEPGATEAAAARRKYQLSKMRYLRRG